MQIYSHLLLSTFQVEEVHVRMLETGHHVPHECRTHGSKEITTLPSENLHYHDYLQHTSMNDQTLLVPIQGAIGILSFYQLPQLIIFHKKIIMIQLYCTCSFGIVVIILYLYSFSIVDIILQLYSFGIVVIILQIYPQGLGI